MVVGIPGQLPPPRVTSYDYDELGRLRKTTRAPDDPALWQATLFRLTSEGLVDKITRSGPEAPSRHVFFAYDDEGVFPRASWNDLAHYARVVHHPALGVAVLREDPNGVRVSATFDGFGRIGPGDPESGLITSWKSRAPRRVARTAASHGGVRPLIITTTAMSTSTAADGSARGDRRRHRLGGPIVEEARS